MYIQFQQPVESADEQVTKLREEISVLQRKIREFENSELQR